MRQLTLILSALILINSCTPEFETIEISSGTADFSKSIAIGDGYLSGYQDGGLGKDGQKRSIAAIIFRSLIQAGGNDFNQALMPDNTGLGISSKPWEYLYVSRTQMGDRTDCKGEVSLGPVKIVPDSLFNSSPYLAPVTVNNLNDFCFPFANTSNLLSNNFHTQNLFYNRVSSGFGNSSVLNAALSVQPTFFVSWLGMEDVYDFAKKGCKYGTLPSPSVFAARLDSILGPLTANGAKGVLATLPNIDIFPFFTTIPWNSANLSQQKADSATMQYDLAGMTHIVFYEGKNGFVIEDAAAPFGYRQMIEGEYMTLQVPLDSMKCQYYGIFASVINDRYVIDTAELTYLRAIINDYNVVITQKAAQYNLALADMNTYFNKLETGIFSNGVLFTNEFVSGGFFSLDGYYPTQKGAALIANQFILAINQKYQSTLPTIYCDDCNGVIFP